MAEWIANRYEVLRPLGSGGMGDVFLVRDERDGAELALKRLRDVAPSALARLRDEFAALARLAHPNIVGVFDYGSLPEGSAFFTMEYLAGKPLDEAVLPGDVAGVLRAVRDIAAGLEALYSAGLVHCDLKPSNLFVVPEPGTGERTRILDFGLAGHLAESGDGRARGTPGYVAPEVLDGGPPTQASDRYALGATLYRVLAGRTPFPGRDAAEILRVQRRGRPSALPLRNAGVPRAFETAILNLLEPDPGLRAPSLVELLDLAERYAGPAPGPGAVASEGTPAGPGTALPRGAMVGRDRELRRLVDHLLAGSSMRVALLGAPPGMGRTRIAREVAIEAELAGWNVVWYDADHMPEARADGRGSEAGGSTSADPDLTSPRTLLVLEDLHRWGPGSLERLPFETLRAPLALLATTGTHPSDAGPLERKLLTLPEDPAQLSLTLSPLDAAAVEELVRSRLAGPPPDGLVPRLVREVGSAPGALDRALDRIAAVAALKRGPEGWQLDPTLLLRGLREAESVPAERLWQELEGTARQALLAVAGSAGEGPAPTLSDVARALGPGLSRTALTGFVAGLEWRGHLERQGEGWRVVPRELECFVLERAADPELAGERRTLLEGLADAAESERPDPRRLRLTGCHARALGERARAADLFRRAHRAAGTDDLTEAVEAARLWLETAAGEGRARAEALAEVARFHQSLGRALEAEELWARALEALPEGTSEERAALTLERAVAMRILGRSAEAHQLLAVDHGPLPATQGGQIALERGWCAYMSGDPAAAERDYAAALSALPPEARSIRATALSRLGIMNYLAGRREEGQHRLEEALTLAVEARDASVEARVRTNLGLMLRHEGRLEEAERELLSAREHFREAGDAASEARVVSNLAALYNVIPDWDKWRSVIGDAERLARASGDLSLLWSSLSSRATSAGRRADLPELRRVLKAQRSLSSRLKRRDLGLHYQVWRAQLLWLMGDDKSARALYRRVARDARTSDVTLFHAEALLGLAEIELAGGNPRRARARFRSCVEANPTEQWMLEAAWLGLARSSRRLRSAELFDEAARQVRELQARSHAMGWEPTLRELEGLECLSHGDPVGAAESFEQSIEGLRRQELFLREIRASWECGLALCDAGAHAQGVRFLARAREEARRRGVQGWSAQIAEDLLAAQDIAPAPAAGPAAAGSALDDRHILYDVSELLNSLLDFPTLLRKSLTLVGERIKADRGFIILVDRETQDLRLMAQFGGVDDSARESALDASRTVIRRVAESGKSFRSDDALQDPRLGSTQSVVDLSVRSLICTPLKLKNQVIGTIYLENRSAAAQFNEADLDLVQSFSNLVAVAIENSRFHDELRRSRDRVIGQNLSLRQEVTGRYRTTNIVGQSSEIERVLGEVERVATSRGNVLLTGESGTGKELIAKTIHYNSPRADRLFLSLNCAALPADLIEAELFGIEDHVATGVRSRPGIFERADGGTLLLDEIGDMPLHLQAQLLRVLQEREFSRLGGRKLVRVDIRLIAATNQDLRQKIREQRFREDLYFRINTLPIHVPPLRERKIDIPLLADHFLRRFCEENGRPVPEMSPEFRAVLLQSSWPGNVRELQNYIERCVVMARGAVLHPTFRPSDLDAAGAGPTGPQEPAGQTPIDELLDPQGSRELKGALEDVERLLILRALAACAGNQSKAARALAIAEPTLRYRMGRLGIGPSKPGRRPGGATTIGQ